MSGVQEIPSALRLTIDLAALVENWRFMALRSRPARTSAVVKANGYGLGIAPVVRALYQAGCRDFFTATAQEGVAARAEAPQARIFVLNGLYPGLEVTLSAAGLIPVLASLEQVHSWRDHCAVAGSLPFALQVDTGMNRLGVSPAEACALAAEGRCQSRFSPELIMSHLACADEPSHALNAKQLQSFQTVMEGFAEIESSLCNSAGIFLGRSYVGDLTRPGIALYGGDCVEGVANPMKPVASAKARILQLRRVPHGGCVSYGATPLARDSVIATAAVGYADGYLRSLSGAAIPLRRLSGERPVGHLAGRHVPIFGRITMDLTMFDVTDVGPDVAVGDFIELFGHQLPLDTVARAAGTIGYEILTSLGDRYARQYIEN
ncbi:alanine racemase [Pararhizobium haloflavum]|uniref:alanine racemase n=1 Tax=Pararhizobium haloflavum TaxID=2037914 RepID=UPI001FE1FD0E|nr:alanine racemase [Pararhizobium haloflavum]